MAGSFNYRRVMQCKVFTDQTQDGATLEAKINAWLMDVSDDVQIQSVTQAQSGRLDKNRTAIVWYHTLVKVRVEA